MLLDLTFLRARGGVQVTGSTRWCEHIWSRMGAPLARKRRQASCHALSPLACRGVARLYRAAGIAEDRKGGCSARLAATPPTVLSEQPMKQSDAWRMIRRRAVAAGIHAPIGNHTFRATGITAYLANGGALEHAQEMAAHESPRTTKLYDRDEGAAHAGRGGEDQAMTRYTTPPTSCRGRR